jgi:hypothetical protein
MAIAASRPLQAAAARALLRRQAAARASSLLPPEQHKEHGLQAANLPMHHENVVFNCKLDKATQPLLCCTWTSAKGGKVSKATRRRVCDSGCNAAHCSLNTVQPSSTAAEALHVHKNGLSLKNGLVG